uniref:Uncharacterized protein n=1 Tax=Leptobrachium leishanense TaxID=445787 RepID=A0A8C5PEL7_9ANUR
QTKWTTDMCDCCDDCGICCCALWCIPCMMCNTASEFGECLCLPLMDPMCMGYVGCSAICPPIMLAMRGSICDDSMISWIMEQQRPVFKKKKKKIELKKNSPHTDFCAQCYCAHVFARPFFLRALFLEE